MWFMDSKVSPWATYVGNDNSRIEVRQNTKTGVLSMEVSRGNNKVEVTIPKEYAKQFATWYHRVYGGAGAQNNVIRFVPKSDPGK